MDYTAISEARRCVISRRSRANNNTPFSALLADKEGNILLEQPNVEITEKCRPCELRAQAKPPALSTQGISEGLHPHHGGALRDIAQAPSTEPAHRPVVYGMTEKSW